MKGKVLAVNTGSTSTKIGFYDSGKRILEKNIAHSLEELSGFDSVMEQDRMRLRSITGFLVSEGIRLEDVDIVMARSGLITPVETGVYEVLPPVQEALRLCANGVHACNLSGLIAAELADEVNRARAGKGSGAVCRAYIADPPMADEMLPEAKVGGLPELPRRALCHALNSRAMVRRYAREKGVDQKDVTVIVAHIGGGTSVTLHKDGKIIDTNDALGGDGPLSVERTGTVPGFPLVEMCFSGKYTMREIKRMLVGKGGAVAFFGTNDMKEIVRRAEAGEKEYSLFVDAFCLSTAKFIAGLSADVCGKVDAIILTGGVAYNRMMMDKISEKVSFICPVLVYPGEDELDSLAENGYGILSGEFEVKVYNPNRS